MLSYIVKEKSPVKVTISSGTDNQVVKRGSVKHGAGSQVASGSGDPPAPPPQEHQAPVPSTSGGRIQITVFPIFPTPRGDFPCTLHYTTLHYTILHYITLHCTTVYNTAFHFNTLHYNTLYHTGSPLSPVPRDNFPCQPSCYRAGVCSSVAGVVTGDSGEPATTGDRRNHLAAAFGFTDSEDELCSSA